MPTLTPTRRTFLGGLAAGTLTLTSCAGPRTRAAGATGPRTLTLGHGAAPGNPRSIAAETFKKLVEEQSDGDLLIQIMGQETVGSDLSMLTSVQTGSLDMSINSQGAFSSITPEINLLGLPFLFEDSEHAYSVVDGDALNRVNDTAAEKGIVVLGYWDNGMRDITNNIRPINTPEDLAGLSIRTPDDPMTVDIFRAFGANPTPMAFGELYMALRQGAVDGQENPVVNIKSSNLQEVQKHLADIGYMYQTNPFVISKGAWESMSEKDRRILQEASDEAREEQRDLMSSQTTEILDELEGQMTVTHPERKAFREATSGVYDDWRERYPEFFEEITASAAAQRSEYEDTQP